MKAVISVISSGSIGALIYWGHFSGPSANPPLGWVPFFMLLVALLQIGFEVLSYFSSKSDQASALRVAAKTFAIAFLALQVLALAMFEVRQWGWSSLGSAECLFGQETGEYVAGLVTGTIPVLALIAAMNTVVHLRLLRHMVNSASGNVGTGNVGTAWTGPHT